MDRHDIANSRFYNFANAPKIGIFLLHSGERYWVELFGSEKKKKYLGCFKHGNKLPAYKKFSRFL